ncbi:flavin reductase [Micromonospora sp. URMC 106]|uniref:flavin reductase n=1 Tax=Micromonospora sp. URMC 106 TaxID=3423408 RepID=UPI003F1A5127
MTRRRDHLPSRPTWRCAACGIAWPCSAAKLRLLGEYRTDRTALLVYLGTLQAEAAGQLAGLDGERPCTDLAERFTGWARPRGRPPPEAG